MDLKMIRRKLPMLVEQAITEASVARHQAMFDFEQKVFSEGSVSCQKGCHHCCYHPVMISIFEGIELFRWLDTHRLWTPKLRASFEATADKTWGLSLEVWTLAEIPCPLLTEGACTAYESRPYACRATFSRGDPYDCHPHRLAEARDLIPKRELHLRVSKEEAVVFNRIQLKYLRIPLASAVLFGERIDKGTLAVEDLLGAVAKQNLKQQED